MASAPEFQHLPNRSPTDLAKEVKQMYKNKLYITFAIRMDSATTQADKDLTLFRTQLVRLAWWGP